MRFHVIALPFTVTSKEFCSCAYTQKVLNFVKMMSSRGHDVFHYGVEGATVAGEHVTVMSNAERLKFCGPDDHSKAPRGLWESTSPIWRTFNGRICGEIGARVEKGDFICHITGASSPVADFTNRLPVFNVEYGIGYTGVFAPYRAFESYAHRTAVWFREQSNDPDGKSDDWVIPNYFDVADFPEGNGKGDYLLFVGRMIRRKGLQQAINVAKAAGLKLVLAGPGAKIPNGITTTREGIAYCAGTKLVTDEVINGKQGEYEGTYMEYCGRVDVAQRAELMGNARAIIVPTLYFEPFGGVNVEAQLCGTPAIVRDWGGLTECVEHARTGYRCQGDEKSIDHWVWAAKNAGALDRKYIRERAISKYSLEKVGDMFDEFFTYIQNKSKTGAAAVNPARDNLDWLK